MELKPCPFCGSAPEDHGLYVACSGNKDRFCLLKDENQLDKKTFIRRRLWNHMTMGVDIEDLQKQLNMAVDALDKANLYMQLADEFEGIEIDGELHDAFEVRKYIESTLEKIKGK